ncbi:MAG: RNA ligase family protein [Methylococcaceae bacterium]
MKSTDGEGYGAKIQKGGHNYRLDQDFVLFDVKINEFWLKETDVISVSESLGLDSVPIIGAGSLNEMIDTTKTGFDSKWGNFRAEGIVARPATELKTKSGHRIITKLKCKDFAY